MRQLYHNRYIVCTFHKLLGFMYLVEFFAYLCRSSMFLNFYEGCLKKKICWCVNMVIFFCGDVG